MQYLAIRHNLCANWVDGGSARTDGTAGGTEPRETLCVNGPPLRGCCSAPRWPWWACCWRPSSPTAPGNRPLPETREASGRPPPPPRPRTTTVRINSRQESPRCGPPREVCVPAGARYRSAKRWPCTPTPQRTRQPWTPSPAPSERPASTRCVTATDPSGTNYCSPSPPRPRDPLTKRQQLCTPWDSSRRRSSRPAATSSPPAPTTRAALVSCWPAPIRPAPSTRPRRSPSWCVPSAPPHPAPTCPSYTSATGPPPRPGASSRASTAPPGPSDSAWNSWTSRPAGS